MSPIPPGWEPWLHPCVTKLAESPLGNTLNVPHPPWVRTLVTPLRGKIGWISVMVYIKYPPSPLDVNPGYTPAWPNWLHFKSRDGFSEEQHIFSIFVFKTQNKTGAKSLKKCNNVKPIYIYYFLSSRPELFYICCNLEFRILLFFRVYYLCRLFVVLVIYIVGII